MMRSLSKSKKFLFNYVVVYSRFLLTNNFDRVRDDLVSLAKNGELHALSKYLFFEKKENLDKNLLEIAKNIEKKDNKSPEEWEVVASLHSKDIVPCFCEHKLCNAIEMEDYFTGALADYDYTRDEYDHGRCNEDNLNLRVDKMFNIYRNLLATDYIKAIKNAQAGYYKNFVNTNNSIDGYSFLELTSKPFTDVVYMSEKEYKDNIFKKRFSRKSIFKALATINKKAKKEGEEDFISDFCYNNSILLCQQKKKDLGYFGLQDIAKQDLITVETPNLNLV